MSPNRKKYIFITVAAIILVVTSYVVYALIKDGTPLVKSQNEFLVEANKLHNDSLFEEAVEPYMRAGKFSGQEALVNYNTAVNSILKNYESLTKSFNEEGYKLDSTVIAALDYAKIRLEKAAGELSDTARYSSAYHNIGVVNHMCNNLEAAAEAYKEALRKNPADEEARYNLAVILHQQQKNNQNQNQQQQEQQEQEQEQKQQDKQEQQQDKEQQEQKEKEKEQQQQQEKEQQQQEKEQQQQKEEQQQQEREAEEEKEKMEQMLKALMQDEKEIREKMEQAEKAKMNSDYIEKNW